MDSLTKAALDFFAAVLALFGVVGRPRRRQHIHDDIDLLVQLRDSPDFGPDSPAHRFLTGHITVEVAKYAGVDIDRKKPIPWGSVAFAVIIGAPLGYWTYKLDHSGFRLLSLLPGIVSGFMLIAVLGMIFSRDQIADEEAAGASA